MVTPKILERYGYDKFEWNNGAIIEYWKSFATYPNDFDYRIGVRFGEWENREYVVWLIFRNHMHDYKNIKTIDQLEQLYTLLSGRSSNANQAAGGGAR